MRSSSEEQKFLNKGTEVNTFFIFVKRLFIQSKRIQAASKEYMKIEQGLYTALGNTGGETVTKLFRDCFFSGEGKNN